MPGWKKALIWGAIIFVVISIPASVGAFVAQAFHSASILWDSLKASAGLH